MRRTIILNGRTVEYEHTVKKVKNINLRIRADGSISVSASKRVSVAAIEMFITSKADFILRALERFEERRKNTPEEPKLVDGDEITVLGKRHLLRVISGVKEGVVLDGENIILTVKDISDKEKKQKFLDKWKRELCREAVISASRAAYPYFEELGIDFPTISFRSMRTRWGSCNSQKRKLNFNYALVQMPPEFIEYVVMHEFVHLIHPDHSKNFYARLAALMPNHKERKKLGTSQRPTP